MTYQLTKNGTPQANTQLVAEDVTHAYDIIKSGNFSSDLTSSAAWQALRTQYQLTGNSIQLSNNLTIGQGHQLSDEQTKAAIQQLFTQAPDFLNAINGSKSGSQGSGMTTNSKQYPFHLPGNNGRFYSDKNGKTTAQLQKGYYLLLNAGKTALSLVDITKNTNAVLDLANPTGSTGLSAKVTGLSAAAKNNIGQYVVAYGQEVNYQLTISKDLLTSDGHLTLNPTAGLVIDSISLPYTTTSTLPTPLDASAYGVTASAAGDAMGLAANEKKLTTAVSATSISASSSTVPAGNSDVTVDIKVHIVPDMKLETTAVNLVTGDNAAPTAVSLQLGQLPADTTAAYQLPIHFSNDSKAMTYTAAAGLVSSGVNFVMADGKVSKLAQGAEYILGKNVNGKTYLYDSQSQWKEVSGAIQDHLSGLTSFVGGRSYNISESGSTALPLATARTNFNAAAQKKQNQSIIQILGLGSGVDYFLYQTKAPVGHSQVTTEQHFTAFANQLLSPNGTIMNKNSLATADKADIAVNSQLAAYSPGTQDYQLLNVSANQAISGSPTFAVIAAFVVAVLVLLAIGFVVMRVS